MRVLDASVAVGKVAIVGLGTAGAVSAVSGVPFAEIAGALAALAVVIRELRITWVAYRDRNGEPKGAGDGG